MDVLKVVQQLRDLAADPQNRATIVRVSEWLPSTTVLIAELPSRSPPKMSLVGWMNVLV